MLLSRATRRHASCSTAGRRAINEDRAATLRLGPDTYVVAVADGMGGTAAGDVASGAAMGAFLETIRAAATEDPRRTMRSAFAAADTAVRNALTAGREGMGTTLTAAIVRGRDVWVGNVGDSRAVLVLPDEVLALSRDHSLVAEAFRSGRMTELEALQSFERHVISRALGEGDATPDIKYHSMGARGESFRATLVAGSDGLFNFVGETEILEIATEEARAPAVVEHLVRRAIENGSDDNVSAAAVRLDFRPARSPLLRAVAALVVFTAVAAAAYPMWRDIGRVVSAIRRAATPDPAGVKLVRLPIAGAHHLRAGASGTLCVSSGDCIGTWRVARVDDESVVLEIRMSESSTAPRGGVP